MTRMYKNPIALGVITILLLILVASTFSIVPETKQAGDRPLRPAAAHPQPIKPNDPTARAPG
jgi:hypothetical protein